MSSTHFTTASGRQVDLYAPRVEDIDFDDIVEQLSKINRYNGATPGTAYSVAQHVVLGADYILAESALDPARREEWLKTLRDGEPVSYFEDTPWFPDADSKARLTAAYFLLHDAEEAYLGDDTTPKKRTIEKKIESFGLAAGVFGEALALIVEEFNRVIHEAAGLVWKPPEDILLKVHEIDQRMLLAEWKALRPQHPIPSGMEDYTPLPVKVQPWRWGHAQEVLAERMALLLPACREKLK